MGKTTLIQKVCDAVKSEVNVCGFYTEEVRAGGRRVGFDVVTVSGERAPLSRVGYGLLNIITLTLLVNQMVLPSIENLNQSSLSTSQK